MKETAMRHVVVLAMLFLGAATLMGMGDTWPDNENTRNFVRLYTVDDTNAADNTCLDWNYYRNQTFRSTCDLAGSLIIVPAGHKLFVQTFTITPYIAATSGNEDCNFALQEGDSDDLGNADSALATIQYGNNSTPDLKDVGDFSLTEINEWFVAGEWLRVHLAARATCTDLTGVVVGITGKLVYVGL